MHYIIDVRRILNSKSQKLKRCSRIVDVNIIKSLNFELNFIKQIKVMVKNCLILIMCLVGLNEIVQKNYLFNLHEITSQITLTN